MPPENTTTEGIQEAAGNSAGGAGPQAGGDTVHTKENPMESFSDDTPIELPENMKSKQEPEAKLKAKSQVENLDEEDDNTDTFVKKSKDENPQANWDKKKEEEEKGDEDEDDSDDESSTSESDETDEGARKSKPFKIKDGDKSLEINPDATMKVKVKGKNEFVSVNDLKKNYEGKVAYTEKFEAFAEKEKGFQKREDQFIADRDRVGADLSHIGKLIDESKDPMEALYYLVDRSGRDVLGFQKKVMAHMTDQVNELEDMDEVERKLYWTQKELDYNRSNQTANEERRKLSDTQREQTAKEVKLRESFDVTPEQYDKAEESLLELGYKKEQLNTEFVARYAVMEPYYASAEDLCSVYDDDLSDNEMSALITEVAVTLKGYPHLSQEQAVNIAAQKQGFEISDVEDDEIDELNQREESGSRTPGKVPTGDRQSREAKRSSNHVESFADFDDDGNNSVYSNPQARW